MHLVLVLAQAEGIPYVASGSAVAGVLMLGALALRWNRAILHPLQDRAEKSEERLNEQAERNEVCEWRLRQLVNHLQKQGLDVPDDIMESVPPWINKQK